MTTLGGRAPAGGQNPICRVGLSRLKKLKKNAVMITTAYQSTNSGTQISPTMIIPPIATSSMP